MHLQKIKFTELIYAHRNKYIISFGLFYQLFILTLIVCFCLIMII